VIIVSSPFLRALQTGLEVAKVLGVKEIYLDFLISEVQTKGVFNAHPQDTLICMGNK
tara:strand:- start:63 stop:233 length:171 start_codon:yes stop_codon:yes gene_type:complete